jgi:hypothetical protein
MSGLKPPTYKQAEKRGCPSVFGYNPFFGKSDSSTSG